MSLCLSLGRPFRSTTYAGHGIGVGASRPRLAVVGISRPSSFLLSCGRRGGNSGDVWRGEGEGKRRLNTSRACASVGAASATGGAPVGWFCWGINTKGKSRGRRVVCSAAALDLETLQWISSISCLVLMLSKGTAIQKSFLAPLFALQAPSSVISWIKGEYGIWTAFLALIVRLFYFIPGELDLPFSTMLLVIVSPQQTMSLRNTKTGAIISVVIAGYLLFHHFSKAESLQKAFDQGSIVATLSIICVIALPCLLLF